MLRFSVGIIAALVAACVLEVVVRPRASRASGDMADVNASASANVPGRAMDMSVGRLVLSALIGFFLGAVTAGFLEAAGAAPITLGSISANLLIAGWTFLAWLFLALRD